MKSETIMKIVAIGTIAGMRSMSAPAFASSYLARNDNWTGSRLALFASPPVSRLLEALAAAEMIADKLPVGDRVSAGPLIARVASGALSAAAVCVADKERADAGAVLGGLAAVAGAYAFYHLRRRVGELTAIPDPVLGLAEDALVIAGRRTLTKANRGMH